MFSGISYSISIWSAGERYCNESFMSLFLAIRPLPRTKGKKPKQLTAW